MRFLEPGDVIRLCNGHRVSVTLPYHFCYSNAVGNFDEKAHKTVTIGTPTGPLGGAMETGFLAGDYIVTKTDMSGGGTGHGPHDVVPDGHHVTCRHTKHQFEVQFYQSGCFNCMVRPGEVEIIGKAKQNWSL